MARDKSKEELRAILIQAMSAAKSARVQIHRLLHLRRRLKQWSPDDKGAAVVQEVAPGLFKVYYFGLEYASRYLSSVFQIAVESGARFDDINFAFVLIPHEQLYDVLLAQRLPARATTQAQALARIGDALHAVKLAEEHHVPRCIELLTGEVPPTVTGKPLSFMGMAGYSDDPVSAAHEHLAKNGFRKLPQGDAAAAATGKPPRARAASTVDLDQALSYLHRACSLASLAVKHIDLAVAFFSSFFDPKQLADTAEDVDRYIYIPDNEEGEGSNPWLKYFT